MDDEGGQRSSTFLELTSGDDDDDQDLRADTLRTLSTLRADAERKIKSLTSKTDTYVSSTMTSAELTGRLDTINRVLDGLAPTSTCDGPKIAQLFGIRTVRLRGRSD